MSLPLSISELPKSCALDLSKQEREALPDIEWEAYTAPAYKHLCSVNTLGTWYIGHPMEISSGHEPVEICYETAMDEGDDWDSYREKLKGLSVEDVEWWRLRASQSKQELGRVYDQDHAKIFIDRARRAMPGKTAEHILVNAGFTWAHEVANQTGPIQVFNKTDDNRGVFSVYLGATSFWLTHQKRNANHWTNLLSFYTASESQGGGYIPRFLSPEVADPLAACADMASYFIENWKPAPSRSPRRPSP